MSAPPRIAFLGAGNMAAAMVNGLMRDTASDRRSGAPAAFSPGGEAALPPPEIVCHTASGKSAESLAKSTGIRAATTLDDLLAGATLLVVAFKPQHLAGADPRLAELTEGKLVLSVLAGKTLAALAAAFPRARNIVRAMPNTPSRIGAGMTGWCALKPLAGDDSILVKRLLGAMGQEVEVPESQMDALTAISGSGPAYLFEFAAALRDGGVAAGLPAALSEKLAVQTLLGAGQLLAQRGLPPEKLRDEVTSPNGVTFAGLQRLAAGNLRGLVADTVKAARARAEELAR